MRGQNSETPSRESDGSIPAAITPKKDIQTATMILSCVIFTGIKNLIY